jgi:uncharacterized LabA/DUF88 family protein
VSKNVAVFVDVANIFYAAKAAGVDIDYVTLLKSATAGRDLVRAYAYTGLDPDNENQRNFHSFLARHGYKVVSKDIRKYGDGKVKANLDIELVVDMMKTSRNLDIAIVVSGDGDFAPAIRAVQETGVRVEVISFRGNTSSDLIDVADQFTDIVHLARVEKASSRSGRRVAGDDEDLSMTEVPDKQTEGTGAGRGRGRGRGAGAGTGVPSRREREPVAARSGRRPAEPAVAVTSSGAPLVVLPGEKLSKVASLDGGPEADDDAVEPVEVISAAAALPRDVARDVEGEAGRRRRRRGGRGRGRGRQRGEGGEAPIGVEGGPGEIEEEREDFVEAPRLPRTPRATPFGSVWDSQLGVSSPTPTPIAPRPDDDDLDEPEIPEYLIAERNRGRSAPGGGGPRGRGNRAAYAAAMDRERYGRGGAAGGVGGGGSGINRYPDVSGRERPRDAGFPRRDRPERQDRPVRQDRPDRPDRNDRPAPRSGGGDPWSEVPPELEAMLRAQVSSRPRPEPRPSRETTGEPQPRGEAVAGFEPQAAAAPAPEAEAEAPRRSTRGRRPAAAKATASGDGAAGKSASAPAKRTATRRPTKAAATADAARETAAPKRRTTRKPAASASTGSTGDADGGSPEAAAEPDAAKRRTTRRRTTASDASADASTESPSS